VRSEDKSWWKEMGTEERAKEKEKERHGKQRAQWEEEKKRDHGEKGQRHQRKRHKTRLGDKRRKGPGAVRASKPRELSLLSSPGKHDLREVAQPAIDCPGEDASGRLRLL
jgi:hypothetical protein